MQRPIALYGVSMGAASVLLAAQLPELKGELACVVADCAASGAAVPASAAIAVPVTASPRTVATDTAAAIRRERIALVCDGFRSCLVTISIPSIISKTLHPAFSSSTKTHDCDSHRRSTRKSSTSIGLLTPDRIRTQKSTQSPETLK